MLRNDIILPTVVSLLKETVVCIECLPSRPAPGGHLAKFLRMVKSSQTFQGVVLRGSLEGKVKRGGIMTGSLQSEVQTAVNLCMKGLSERFHILAHAAEPQPSSKTPNYGPKQVVRDLLIFNVDAWPTHSSELMEYGREELQCLSDWFKVALEKAGCNTQKHPKTSLKIQVNCQFHKLDYANLWQTLPTKGLYNEDFKDVLHLVEILLVLLISAARCKRAVPSQNLIKSSTRSSLAPSAHEDLIHLS